MVPCCVFKCSEALTVNLEAGVLCRFSECGLCCALYDKVYCVSLCRLASGRSLSVSCD